MRDDVAPDGHARQHGMLSIEQQTIEDIRAGDMQAFEAFYKEYRPKLSQFIARSVPVPASVDEVFNDTMMVVWDKIEEFKGESKLSTWVYAIAYRKVLKIREKKTVHTVPELEEDNASQDTENHEQREQEQAFERGSVRSRLVSALEQLPDDQGAVVNLAYFHDMHYREIAEVLDCPTTTVKTRMFYARRKLKSILGGTFADWA